MGSQSGLDHQVLHTVTGMVFQKVWLQNKICATLGGGTQWPNQNQDGLAERWNLSDLAAMLENVSILKH